jgi:hypothetical protein
MYITFRNFSCAFIVVWKSSATRAYFHKSKNVRDLEKNIGNNPDTTEIITEVFKLLSL